MKKWSSPSWPILAHSIPVYSIHVFTLHTHSLYYAHWDNQPRGNQLVLNTAVYVFSDTQTVFFQDEMLGAINKLISHHWQYVNPMFLFILCRNKAWLIGHLVGIAWQQRERGIRHCLTTSHLWNASKREMASIRDFTANVCSLKKRGEGVEITHTDNCLSLGEPSMFVCGWLSKFTSSIGQGELNRPKAWKH